MQAINRVATVKLSVFNPLVITFIKSAKEYSVHSASLDGDEFRIVGETPTINLRYGQHSSLKLKFVGFGRKSAG
jgi:hypothetical protein